MNVPEFLELFVKELELNADLRGYYRLINNNNRFLWRNAYLEQRLEYVYSQLGSTKGAVWDVGCGYGTTAIFLALNGYEVYGNTLEFYYDKIRDRLQYWGRYGDLSGLKLEYANLFDIPVRDHTYDIIIAQDTLHHLEPIEEALAIFNRALKPEGRLIVIEENGQGLFIRLKNFAVRGFKKTGEYYDPRLNKKIPFGNENARSYIHWRKLFNKAGLDLQEKHTEYIRFLPPFCFKRGNYRNVIEKEKRISKNCGWIRKYLFFGINFTAVKTIKTDKK